MYDAVDAEQRAGNAEQRAGLSAGNKMDLAKNTLPFPFTKRYLLVATGTPAVVLGIPSTLVELLVVPYSSTST